MKYEAPYGVADPNASYINGNPSTGTMGSIPPAASIENPQREIVNLITDAAMTPTDADLHQLSKAVQSGKLNYADDTGSVNVLGLNCVPQIAALQKGMIFITKAATTNTGPTVATVNGLTAPVVHPKDASPLLAFDINVGQILAIAFDGANFQLAWSATGTRAAGVLQANYDFYVNGSTGSDTLYDGTTPTVTTGGHGPFLTIQAGVNAASKLNANGFQITIHVANGTYPPFGVTNVTNGTLYVQGNPTTPDACLITSSTQIQLVGVRGTGVNMTLDGFKLVNSFSPGYGLVSQINSSLNFLNMDFGLCTTAHCFCDTGSMALAANGYTISGASGAHILFEFSTFVLSPSTPTTINIVGNPAITCFANGFGIGYLRAFPNTTFVGSTVGQKFSVSGNSIISSNGGGINFLPGTIAGVTATGGQYI